MKLSHTLYPGTEGGGMGGGWELRIRGVISHRTENMLFIFFLRCLL